MTFRMPTSCSFGGLMLLVATAACTDPAMGEDTTSTDGGTQPTSTAQTPMDSSGEGDTTTDPGTATDDTTGDPAPCSSASDPECPDAPGAMPTELLDQLLADDALRVVDVRAPDDFDASHIPGAIVVDESALRATVDGIGGQVAPPDEVQAVFEAAGLLPSDPIVVYGAANGTTPARVVWTFAYSGHTGPVWMLDGGFNQWSSEGRVVESDADPIEMSSYEINLVADLRVDAQWVLDRIDDPDVTLVDARSPGEYTNGRIPGAISVDWVTNLGEDGLYLPSVELVALYGDPNPTQTFIVYCQTGSRASVDWLVLTMLGYADVRIYDGSWSEWSADPMYPQES